MSIFHLSRGLLPSAFTVLWSLGVAPSADAQTTDSGFEKVAFNFNPPGARSAGLGGAFIALADDATAVESNPAGLTVLLYPQLSAEVKAMQYQRYDWLEPGDEEFGYYDHSRTTAKLAPTFMSGVWPTRRATLALFRSQIVNYSLNKDLGRQLPGDQWMSKAQTDITVDNVGLGVARRLGRRLSVGVSGGMSAMRITQWNTFDWQDDTGEGHTRSVIDGDEGSSHSVFANAGAILRFGESFSAGAVYKLRKRFDALAIRNTGSVTDTNGETVTWDFPETFTYDAPDAVGLGLASRIGQRFTWSLDAEYIMYEDLRKYSGDELSDIGYWIKNGTDVRAGVEYAVVIGRTPVGLRAGAARTAPSYLWTPNPEGPQWTGSVGFGTVLAQRWQLDAAMDSRKGRANVTTSLVYFFGRL